MKKNFNFLFFVHLIIAFLLLFSPGFTSASALQDVIDAITKDASKDASPKQEEKSLPEKPNSPLVTFDQYNKIKPGMDYEQINNIIGFKGKESSSTKLPTGEIITVYSWTCPYSHATIIGSFINNKLQSKLNDNRLK